MSAIIKIDQVGIASGSAGISREDGLDDGGLVTLTSTGAGNSHQFRLLWVPPGDTTAVASLDATGDPTIWTFTPTAGVYGTYRIELEVDGEKTIRTFSVNTPNYSWRIPAFNERAASNVNLTNPSSEFTKASEYNVPHPSAGGIDWSGWFRAVEKFMLDVDDLIAENVDRAIQKVQVIAVGNGGTVYRSFDGVEYENISDKVPSSNHNAVLYSPEKNLYIIAGSDQELYITTNGLLWTTVTLPIASGEVESLFYSKYHGKFFAVGFEILLSSYDGLVWQDDAALLPFGASIKAIEEGDDGLLVGVGTNSESNLPIVYSEDGGESWSFADSLTGSQTDFKAVVKTANGYMAVAQAGTDGAARSSDGKAWTAIPIGNTSTSASRWVAYIPHLDRLVADSGEDNGPVTSDDNGDTWTLRTWADHSNVTTDGGYSSLNGKVIVTGNSFNIESSPDGVTWSSTTPAGAGAFSAVNARSLRFIETVPGTDPNALHTNVSGEIASLPEKLANTTLDMMVIEDVAASNAKKKLELGNLSVDSANTTYDASGTFIVSENVQGALSELGQGVATVSEGTASRTLSSIDHGKMIVCSAVDTTISLPDTIQAGFSCLICYTAASGDLNVAAVSTAQIRHPDGHLQARTQYSVIGITYIGGGEYILTGDTKA